MKYKFIDNSKTYCFLYTFLSIFLSEGKKQNKEKYLWSVLTILKKNTKKDPFTQLTNVLSKFNLLCQIKHLKVGNTNFKLAISLKKKSKRKIVCKQMFFNVKHLYTGHKLYDKLVKEILLNLESSNKTVKTVENIYTSMEYNKNFIYNKH